MGSCTASEQILATMSGAVGGNLVPDAWFAALAIESACERITLDRDYTQFPGLKWTLPS
jgi:predicted nucleic acid-binding protein